MSVPQFVWQIDYSNFFLLNLRKPSRIFSTDFHCRIKPIRVIRLIRGFNQAMAPILLTLPGHSLTLVTDPPLVREGSTMPRTTSLSATHPPNA